MAKHAMQTKGVIFDLSDTLLVGSINRGIARVDYTRPGLRDALAWLTEKGIQKGVVTSYQELGAVALVQQAGVAEFFEQQHIVGDGSVRKLTVDRTEPQKLPGLKGLLRKTQDVVVQRVIDHKIRSKPDPEPVRYLLHDWQLQPEQVAYVGDDSYTDMMCAAGAGVNFLQIIPISVDPDRDLLRFLKDRIQ